MASLQYFFGDLFVLNSYILTNYTSKCLDFQNELIDTITTSNLKFKEKNENDMTFCYFSFLGRYCFRPTFAHCYSGIEIQMQLHKVFSPKVK